MTCSRSTIGQHSSQRKQSALSLSLLLLLAGACVLAIASAPHPVAATGVATGEAIIPDAPLSAPLPALSWSHRGGSASKRLVATRTTPRRATPAHLQQHQPTRHWTLMQATEESSTGAADSSSSSTGGKPIGTNEVDTLPLPRGHSAAMCAVLIDLSSAACVALFRECSCASEFGRFCNHSRDGAHRGRGDSSSDLSRATLVLVSTHHPASTGPRGILGAAAAGWRR
jgi:hypothetical protein